MRGTCRRQRPGSEIRYSKRSTTTYYIDTFGGEGEAQIPPFDAVAFDIGALWDINSPAGQAP